MNKGVNKVDAVIGGEIITLVSGEDEEYMQKLARYINRKLDEIKAMKTTASLNEKTKALVIALNIADDFYKTADKLTKLEGEHEKFVVEMGRMQEEINLLNEKILELQNSLERTRVASVLPDKQNVVRIKSRAAGGRR
ncbi:MAG: cell division protein ZapA [Clostridiales bacterium]|jgi:cell division protein ZapA|nr:cell division protein ZapA [Clostridiales bacterium]